jgi:hypothetical protein
MNAARFGNVNIILNPPPLQIAELNGRFVDYWEARRA